MSEKLKHILKGGEEPYQAKAWEDLSARLDQLTPVKSSKMSFYKLAGIFTVLSVLTSAIIYVSVNSDQEVKDKKQDKNTSAEVKQEIHSSEVKHQITEQSLSESNDQKGLNSEKPVVKPTFQKEQQKSETIKPELVVNSAKNNTQPNQNPVDEKPVIRRNGENTVSSTKEVEFPKLKNSYCLGEVILIKNTNTGNLFLINDQDERVSIHANSTKEVKITSPGSYYFKYYARSEKMYQQDAFQVAPGKNIAISSNEEIFYENGIPYFEVSSKDYTENSTWKTSKGIINEQSAAIKVRCMEKGAYTVTLSQTNTNSCITTESVQVSIKDNYNLLAVNAFIPNDNNPKNRTFMPEALKHRQTGFKLIIFDSKDNHVVFQSESADLPWDGIDQMTGKMVDSKHLYIWKVELRNPEPQERSEYTGTIVRL